MLACPELSSEDLDSYSEEIGGSGNSSFTGDPLGTERDPAGFAAGSPSRKGRRITVLPLDGAFLFRRGLSIYQGVLKRGFHG